MIIREKNWIYSSIILSLFFHYFFFFIFLKQKEKSQIEKITVINLGQFKQPAFSEKKKASKKTNDEPVKKNPKETEKKEVKEKKNQQKIPKRIKKEEAPININNSKKLKKIDEKTNTQSTKLQKSEIKPNKTPTNINNDLINVEKKKFQSNSNLKKIQDSLLSAYLLKISEKLNIEALNSYPVQSQRRREEGTVTVRITLDKFGNLVNFVTITKRPKRLIKAATELITEFKRFPSPPEYLFSKSRNFSFEVNLNYRLK